MVRYLVLLLTLLPSIAVAQIVDDPYMEKKLGEARRYQRQFEHKKAIEVLDELYAQSVKNKNDFAAGMALMKKTHYTIENGDFTTEEPDWAALESFRLRDEVRNTLLKIDLCKVKATYYKTKGGNYSEAFRFLDEGIRLAGDSPEYQPVLAELYYLYGQLKGKTTQYIEANTFFLKAMRIYDQSGDEESALQLYSELANASFLIGEKERAIDYARKGIEAMKKHRDYEDLAVQLSNLARMYHTSGDSDNAIRYFTESAEYASRSARKETRFISLVDLALVYHARKDRGNALKYMEQAIAEGRKIGQPKLHRYIRTCAMFAGYTGNEELMNRYYDESYALALKDNDREALRDWHGSQNFYYAQVKGDKTRAYPFLEKFHAYKDSIVNERSRKDFNELEVQYQAEKKQAEIDRLSTERKIQTLEIERKNALIRGNRLEALEKQKEIELLTKEKEINDLKIARQAEALRLNEMQIRYLDEQKKVAEQENQLKEKSIRNEKLARNLVIASSLLGLLIIAFFINRMLLKKKIEQKNMLLKERNRISSELHDEVGSTLTAINLLSHAAMKNTGPETPVRQQVEKIRDNTREVMENISDIVWSMNPENNSFQSIRARMIDYLETVLETADIDYTFEMDDAVSELKMTSEKRRDFYLIFKEAVNNLSKYSRARRVEIKIIKDRNFIEMSIRDNGVGFDERLVKRGNGLTNMKKRAERNGGSLEIRSAGHFPASARSREAVNVDTFTVGPSLQEAFSGETFPAETGTQVSVQFPYT